VETAFKEIHAALAAQDLSGACGRLIPAQMAITDWMSKMPGGPRTMRMGQAVTALEELQPRCARMKVEAVAEKVRNIRKSLDPEP
jgi:hypothetical protein